jgi:hypothetical protein
MKSGTVKLMSTRNHVIKTETYHSQKDIRNTLERWKKLYPDKDVLIINICPDDPEQPAQSREVVRKNRPQETEPPPPAFIRPPAIYDNSKSLYP